MNARSLTGRFDQFESWICNVNPDVIAITESWTNDKILDSELSLPGYTMFRKDRPGNREGGGVLLYIRSILKPFEVSPSTGFPEQVWCGISDSSGRDFYLGVCYRTPTDNIFGSGNHEVLRELLTEIGGSDKHFILIGDFNYSFRKWPIANDMDAPTTEAQQFVECLDDNFFTQHVTFPTRKNAILDLIITDKPDMVQNLEDLGAFDKSDHTALLWTTSVRTVTEKSSRQVFDYSKADITGMKMKLQTIDWQQLFGTLSVEDCWSVFKQSIHDLELQYVPVKFVRPAKPKPIWMSHKALKAVKRRHKVYRKYKDRDHPACKRAESGIRCSA